MEIVRQFARPVICFARLLVYTRVVGIFSRSVGLFAETVGSFSFSARDALERGFNLNVRPPGRRNWKGWTLMTKSRILSLLLAVVASAAFAAEAKATSLLFTSTDNNASASLDLTGTTLTITLNNLTPAASTTGAVNLLTGFSLTPSITGAGFSLTSQTAAQKMALSSDTTGSVSNVAFNPNWDITSKANSLYFGGFGGGTPGSPIIGAAIGDTSYPNGGSSLTSGPHGDYAYKSATFVLTVPGSFVLSSTGMTANFLFNTDGATVVASKTPTITSVPPVPLPAAAWSGLALLGGLGVTRKVRQHLQK